MEIRFCGVYVAKKLCAERASQNGHWLTEAQSGAKAFYFMKKDIVLFHKVFSFVSRPQMMLRLPLRQRSASRKGLGTCLSRSVMRYCSS